MNRRTVLASLPALALSGCAARLGLVDRVEVAAKYVRAVDRDGERERELARRRADDGTPSYEGQIADLLAADVDDGSPLVVPESTGEALEGEFREVTYGAVVCAPEGARDCREVQLFLDDFNEIEVGDVVELRVSDGGAGLVDVHRRRDERG